MGLPIVQLPSDEFTFKDGQTIKYRGLSRAETLQVRLIPKDQPKAIEAQCIAFSTGVTLEEAEAWLEATPQDYVEDFTDAIAEISGLNPAQGKADAGASHSAKSTE